MGARGASENWVRPRADVEAWFDKAAPDERLVYGRGGELPRNETSLYVRELALAGLVCPHQPRSDDGIRFDFIIRKLEPQKPARSARAEAGDPFMDAVLRAFRRAANLGQRAPSDSALMRLAGLDTIAQAKWRVRKLALAGLIRTETLTTGPDAGWRIVEMLDHGEVTGRTKAPPSFEAAAAQVRQEPIDRGRDRPGARRGIA